MFVRLISIRFEFDVIRHICDQRAPRETKTGGGKATDRDHAQRHLSAADSEKGGPGELDAEGEVIPGDPSHCTWGVERRAEFSALGPRAAVFWVPAWARWQAVKKKNEKNRGRNEWARTA